MTKFYAKASRKRDTIAEQAMEIRKLRAERKMLRNRLSSIHNLIYCTGGPLNDNKRQYTKEQLADWFFVAGQANF